MLKHRLSTTLIATAIGLGAFTMNAGAASITGTANAKILAPLAITETTEMGFGDISPDLLSATTVVLTTGGVRSSSDGAGLVPGGTAVAAGIFALSGAGNLAYAITLPGDTDVTLTSGADSMAVDTFISSPVGTGALNTGAGNINVGATLKVGADQATGTYAGAYTVIVEYN